MQGYVIWLLLRISEFSLLVSWSPIKCFYKRTDIYVLMSSDNNTLDAVLPEMNDMTDSSGRKLCFLLFSGHCCRWINWRFDIVKWFFKNILLCLKVKKSVCTKEIFLRRIDKDSIKEMQYLFLVHKVNLGTVQLNDLLNILTDYYRLCDLFPNNCTRLWAFRNSK